ncbi:hypothetical protein LKL35_36835 [Streptomyces sp. ET3-23]|uniref:hypothetical protein n=1 Tax=Streptomyces sp. ET3-23 TaxID=2885643 RepID=UPI001D110620|nr:hypothetical protein [Streptomyces sp. ET3-23]MCC2280892.1 hypothetical protein [Streptomyces sp. ET3-23]
MLGGRAAVQQCGNDGLARVWGQDQRLLSQTFQCLLNSGVRCFAGCELIQDHGAFDGTVRRVLPGRPRLGRHGLPWDGPMLGIGELGDGGQQAQITRMQRAESTADGRIGQVTGELVQGAQPCPYPAACGSDLSSNNAVSCAEVRRQASSSGQLCSSPRQS